MAEFDPYLKWLGIRENMRPLDHYTLLGIERFEDDQEVIVSAADRQMAHVRSFQTGARGAIAQKVLNQLARARRCLMTENKKAEYDQQLKIQLQATESSESSDSPEETDRLQLATPSPVVVDTGKPVVSDSEFVVNAGEASVGAAEGMARRRKSNSGVLWTVVGGVGGGLCAILFCYVLLNNTDWFKAKGDADSQQTDSQQPDDDSNTEEQGGPQDTEFGANRDKENRTTGNSDLAGTDGGSNGESGSQRASLPPSVDPSEKKGADDPDPFDPGRIFGREQQVQQRLDALLQRYRDRVNDRNGIRPQELAALRREANDVVAQHPGLKLVNRIEVEFPADAKVGGPNDSTGSDAEVVDVPSLDLPSWVSESDLEIAKLEVPGLDSIREQEDLVDSVYEVDFKNAKDDPVAGHELAKRMVAEAEGATESPALKYVLFAKTVELSKKIGDGESAARGFLGLRQNFELDTDWEEIHQTFDAISRKVKTDEQARVFYRGMDRMLKQAVKEGEYAEAEFLSGKGASICRRQEHPMGEEYCNRVRGYFADQMKIQEEFAKANSDAETGSSDPAFLLSRGNSLVYLDSDSQGFDDWAKSGNETLSALAAKEIEFAADPTTEAQFELGRAWFEMSKEYESYEDHFGMARAGTLLRAIEAQPDQSAQLGQLKRAVATKCVDRIDDVFAPLFVDDQTIGDFPGPLKANKVFYFVGEDGDAKSLFPRGVFLEFTDSSNVHVSFEVEMKRESDSFDDRGSYNSNSSVVSFLPGNRKYQMMLHGTKQPMAMSLEFRNRKNELSPPILLQQAAVPSRLPDNFRGQNGN